MTYMYSDPTEQILIQTLFLQSTKLCYGMGFLHQKKTCPTLPSTGPIFAGKGTGHFSSSGEQIRS